MVSACFFLSFLSEALNRYGSLFFVRKYFYSVSCSFSLNITCYYCYLFMIVVDDRPPVRPTWRQPTHHRMELGKKHRGKSIDIFRSIWWPYDCIECWIFDHHWEKYRMQSNLKCIYSFNPIENYRIMWRQPVLTLKSIHLLLLLSLLLLKRLCQFKMYIQSVSTNSKHIFTDICDAVVCWIIDIILSLYPSPMFYRFLHIYGRNNRILEVSCL